MHDILDSVFAILAQAAPLASSATDTVQSGAAAVAPAADGLATLGSTVGNAAQTASAAAPALQQAPAALDAGANTSVLSFVQQSDWVGKGLFIVLAIMSLASWYLIIVKGILSMRLKRRSTAFVREFWSASSLEQVENEIATHGAREPFAHLASHAIHAQQHHAKYGAMRLEEKGSTGDFIARIMRKVIDEETARLENGLTLLASVGSTAPFVGLFGTVWGVYHALINIGLADGVTINHIAGPVGEALVMTGLGLAVAIPAVLGYNAFVRTNRVYLAKLDAFAHDLFTFLSTGQQVQEGQVHLRRVPSSGANASHTAAAAKREH